MKKGVIAIVIVVLLLLIPIGGWLIFEIVPSITWKEVSSFKELQYASGNVKLTADIDCEYETISGFNCEKINGQGYTIKNCITTSNSLLCAKEVCNIAFENITVNCSSTSSIEKHDVQTVGIISTANGSSIILDNIHVKNSEITVNRKSKLQVIAGVVYGGFIAGDGVTYWGIDTKISNCSVADCKITVKKYNTSSSSDGNIYVGGVAGACNSISNCSVSDCVLEATASTIYGYPHIGGIVGYTAGSVEKSASYNNEIMADATCYQSSGLSGYSSSTVYSGGIAAYSKGEGSVKYCCSEKK